MAALEQKNAELAMHLKNPTPTRGDSRTQNTIRTLQEKMEYQNRELEASKILHNRLVEKLREKEGFTQNDGPGIEDLESELKLSRDLAAKKDLEIQDLTEEIENLESRLHLLGEHN
jgi:phage-related tail protein